MKYLFGILLLFPFTAIFAQDQDTLDDYITRQFIAENFEELRNTAQAHDMEDLGAMSLYYIGLAYFSNEQDSTAGSFFDASIMKYPHQSNVYYYRGLTFLYAEVYNEAIRYFNAAAKISTKEPDYYEALSEAYFFKGKSDSAIMMLEKALALDDPRDDVFLKLADLHLENDDHESALKVYYDCLYSADPESQHYRDCLYNIAYFEYENGNYEEAEMALNDLLTRDPDDFKAMEKLLQVYFSMKKFENIRNLRLDLYQAYKKNELPGPMSSMFCFDQFNVKEYRVKAYEFFAEPSVGHPYKHVFFVTNEEDTISFTIQTEHNKSVAAQGKTYVLTMIKDDQKSVFNDYMYDKVLDYGDLVAHIEKVIKGKTEPSRTYDIPEEERIED